jgi:hypothetical protein
MQPLLSLNTCILAIMHSCSLLPLCPPTHMQLLLSLIHLCISFSLSLIGLRPVRPFSSVGATVWQRRGFLPRWWLASHSASLRFWVAGWVFLCLVLFAARLSVFLCAPPVLCYFCLLCLFRFQGDGLLGAARLRWGWGRTPTLPPCACLLLPGILVGCS